jgi:hypothetical protein
MLIMLSAVTCGTLLANPSYGNHCYRCTTTQDPVGPGYCVLVGLGQPGFESCTSDPGFECIINISTACTGDQSTAVSTTSVALEVAVCDLAASSWRALFPETGAPRIMDAPVGGSNLFATLTASTTAGLVYADVLLGELGSSFGLQAAPGEALVLAPAVRDDGIILIGAFQSAASQPSGSAVSSLKPGQILFVRTELGGTPMGLMVQPRVLQSTDDPEATELKARAAGLKTAHSLRGVELNGRVQPVPVEPMFAHKN